MTISRVLTPVRRAMVGALAVGAFVVACETRRPDPVAPITDYVMQDGRTTAIAGTVQSAESVKVRLDHSLGAAGSIAVAGNPGEPIIVVHDATGTVLLAKRMDTSVLHKIRSAEIATVDVVKRHDLLPLEARSGLIRVVLKPDASWKPPTAADTSLLNKVRVVQPQVESPLMRTEPVASPHEAEWPAPMRVVLQDGSATVLYDGPATGKLASGVGPWRFTPDAIASVDVHKRSGSPDTITIRLKAGARIEKR